MGFSIFFQVHELLELHEEEFVVRSAKYEGGGVSCEAALRSSHSFHWGNLFQKKFVQFVQFVDESHRNYALTLEGFWPAILRKTLLK